MSFQVITVLIFWDKRPCNLVCEC